MCESDEKYVPLNDGYNWKGDPNATLSGQPIPQLPPGRPLRTRHRRPPPAYRPRSPWPNTTLPPVITSVRTDRSTPKPIWPTAPQEQTWQTMLRTRRGTDDAARHSRTTMPCVSATMTPRTTMNATLPPTSIAVSRHSPALVGGGRKNSVGRSFMLTRCLGCALTSVTFSSLTECTDCRRRSPRAAPRAAAPARRSSAGSR